MSQAAAVIDLAPTINQVVLPLVATVLTAFASWALARVAKLAHFQLQDGQRALVGQAIDSGVAMIQKRLAAGETIHTDGQVASVVNYVLPKVPDALKGLGVTPDHLASVIQAKLPATPVA